MLATIGMIFAFVLVLVFIWTIATKNSFKTKKIDVENAKSSIEVALTKRYDMLTKMVDATKQYMQHERDTFADIVKIRKGMSIEDMQEADVQMNRAQSKLFAVAEQYPELRSSEVVKELQLGIRDAEDQLQASRRIYNIAVAAYNKAIVIFPNSLLAGSETRCEFFEADESKKDDVKVSLV